MEIRPRQVTVVAAGLDLLDTEAVPKRVTICNVFGHEPAIAERPGISLVRRSLLATLHFIGDDGSRMENWRASRPLWSIPVRFFFWT